MFRNWIKKEQELDKVKKKKEREREKNIALVQG